MIGIENAIAEDIKDLGEVLIFVVVCEVGVEDMVNVGRVTSEKEVHGTTPWTFEDEGAMAFSENVCEPVMEVWGVEEIRDHTNHRPSDRKTVAGVYEEENGEACNGEEDLWVFKYEGC